MAQLATFNTANGSVGDTCDGYEVEALIDAANGKYRWKKTGASLDAIVVTDITGATVTTVAFSAQEKQLVSYRNIGSSIGIITPGTNTFADGSSNLRLLPGESVTLSRSGTVITTVSKTDAAVSTTIGKLSIQMNTTVASEVVDLPITVDVADSYTIDWGDGSTSPAGTISHTYALAGTYQIHIVGTKLNRFAFANGGHKDKVVSIDCVQLDGFGMTNGSEFFRGCGNAKTTFKSIQTNKLVNASSLFRLCRSAELNIEALSFPEATDTSFMFSACIVAKLPVVTLHAPKVLDASNMFNTCTAAELPLNECNTPLLENAGFMFYKCHIAKLTLQSWDSSLRPFGGSNLPTGLKVAGGMFYECRAATLAGIRNLIFVTTLENTSNMFNSCMSSRVTYFSGTIAATNVGGMFLGARVLTQGTLTFSNATNVEQAFDSVDFGDSSVDVRAPLATTINSLFSNSQISRLYLELNATTNLNFLQEAARVRVFDLTIVAPLATHWDLSCCSHLTGHNWLALLDYMIAQAPANSTLILPPEFRTAEGISTVVDNRIGSLVGINGWNVL